MFEVADDKIRVIIADDQLIIRESLQVLLASDDGIEVMTTVENGRSAIAAIEALQPDVALIDIEMPHVDGLETTKIVRQRFPDVKVLILSSHDDGNYLIDALQAGASGYLFKSTAASEIGKTIRAVRAGHVVFEPGANNAIANGRQDPNTKSPSPIRDELLSSLNELFDSDRLQASAHYFSRHPDANRLWKHLSDEIYGDANSESAFYLAGWFACIHDNNQALAIHYFASGLERGIKSGRDRDRLEAFYRAGKSLQPEVALGWLLRPDGPWQRTETGRDFLLSEAAALFGSKSPTYRGLLVRMQLQAFRAVSRGLADVASQLDDLRREFRPIGAS